MKNNVPQTIWTVDGDFGPHIIQILSCMLYNSKHIMAIVLVTLCFIDRFSTVYAFPITAKARIDAGKKHFNEFS